MPQQNPTPVILVASDLMLSSSVSSCCQTVGRELLTVAVETDAIDLIQQYPTALVLIDLGLSQLDVFAVADSMTAECRQNAVAYGPHVHTAKLQAATDAGIGTVMSRGQFFAGLANLIPE